MTSDDFVPVNVITLSGEDQIRAYIHPTRMTILERLAGEKQSVSGIARTLGVHPANLTHHFKLLEKAGLIKLVEKRDTGKNYEKLYRAAAYHFTVSTQGDSPANKKVLALSILHDNLTAAIEAQRAREDDSPVFGYVKEMRMSMEDIGRFHGKLVKLLDEFAARRPKDGKPYTVNVGFYPGESAEASGREVHIHADD
jgi:DNA-binding transcriptional ArsR family regulator